MDDTNWLNWKLETDEQNILWLCIDKADSSANVLSAAVLDELNQILESVAANMPAGVIIYSGKDNGFVMGADINEFTTIVTAGEAYELIRQGQQVMDNLADLACPTVSVINGFVLGGGLELALACDYRLAYQMAKPIIGLPEVQLGLHPGFGGTVRAVQISGVRAAMEIMLSGKSVTVKKALGWNLVDDVCAPHDWKTAAVTLLTRKPKKASAGLLDKILNLAPLRPLMASMLRKQVSSKVSKKHYPAPFAIVDLWQQYGASPASGYNAEAKSMAELMVGNASRNLVRVFFLQNKLKSQGNKTQTKIHHVHVVGAGVMGGDIAAWCALRGLNVTLQDRAEEYVQPAMDRAARLFDKKTYNETDRAAAYARLTPDVAGEGVAQADLVIEAIYENLDAKKELYAALQAKMKPEAILATNTSSIRLEDLRTDLNDMQRFIGLHFFNPVAQLPLVELVRCADTQADVIDIGFGFIKRISKLGLECMSAPGFVVNRVLAPYMGEAMYLADEGVALADIDKAAVEFGMPMGPVELVDTVGIDVALNVSNVLGTAFGRPVPETLIAMVDAGKLGRKSGQGFYDWKDGKVDKSGAGPSSGIVSSDISDRLILPMLNESVAVLREGVVSDADLLDAGVIFGTGFPPFRGGPLQYARDRGVDVVVAQLERFSVEFGERYRPDPGWQDFH